MPETYAMYRKLSALPKGRTIFGALFNRAAPYFGSAHLRIVDMRPHHGEVVVPLRRSNQNHIGTVHAIAACNGLEAAMGLMAEATCPPDHRWLPKGMDVQYLAKSDSDLVCTADTDEQTWSQGPDVAVAVKARRADGTVTVEGTIHLWVTPRK
jgi:acyl-coenzyme A thioesterase PaaI-like protein